MSTKDHYYDIILLKGNASDAAAAIENGTDYIYRGMDSVTPRKDRHRTNYSGKRITIDMGNLKRITPEKISEKNRQQGRGILFYESVN